MSAFMRRMWVEVLFARARRLERHTARLITAHAEVMRTIRTHQDKLYGEQDDFAVGGARLRSDSQVSAGPPTPRPPRDVLVSKKKAALWSAVWEASEILSLDDIREYVEGTLRDIESDAA